MDKRLKVLISAYACEPGKGSEPGIGWNVARQMATNHDVWVMTRGNNRTAIEEELAINPVSGLRFAYYDLPDWAKWWKKGGRAIQLYYYLWQLGAYSVAHRLHRQVIFDLSHHITFGKYWAPSFAAHLGVPFVWGPVGGGESAPRSFWRDFSPVERRYESLREAARWLGERDSLVRLTARHSSVALATTEDSAARLLRIGASKVRVLSAVGLEQGEIARLRTDPDEEAAGLRFVSIGRLLGWKGFRLGLRAFAAAAIPGAEYWVIGDGPERARLGSLVASLGIADRVTFFGQLPREGVLEKLRACAALIHPSLHDSGGWVCLEAMAAGKPVLCLDLGGPAVQVTPATGFKVAARDPEQAVSDLAEAMQRLAEDKDLARRLGEAGRRRVSEVFTWEHKGEVLSGYYAEALRKPS